MTRKKIKVAATTAREPDALPSRIQPQLATLVERPPQGAPWSYEIKFDGYRILCRIERNHVTLFTRNGHDWTDRMPTLAKALARLPVDDAWIDGEVVMMNEAGTPDFAALQNAFARRRTAGIKYFAFDLLFVDGHDLRSQPLRERRAALHATLRDCKSAHVRFSEAFEQDAHSLLASARRMGLEGLVGKRLDRPYVEGRSTDWVKVKCVSRQEFVVGGFTRSKGAKSGVQSLLLGVHESDGSLRYAGAVKSPSRPTLRVEVERGLRPVRSPAFFNPPPPARDREIIWTRPEMVVEVSFLEWTPAGELRQAVFHGLREDKPASQIVVEKPNRKIKVDDEPSGSRQVNGRAKVGSSAITNPHRVVDPVTGVTKLDIVRYYDAIAPWMLAHIADRPLMLVRAPNGLRGEMFYQKHAEAQRLKALTKLPVSLDPHHPPLLVANSTEALVELAQLNVIEVHAWNATAANLDLPDRFILDLDPDPQLKWKTMQEATMFAKILLDEIGLTSFCKTSGGKGVHIVVPIERSYTWDEVRIFTHAIARHLARVVPQRFSAVSGPKNRIGKIFVDYLRNGRGATTATALTVRRLQRINDLRWIDHLADDSRQQSWRVLPTDQVEALEGLVDEVERMTGAANALSVAAESRASASTAGETPAAIAVSRVRSAASRWRTFVQRRSQRLSAAGSGRLPSGARSRRGASPSQSAATRRAPWNRARIGCFDDDKTAFGRTLTVIFDHHCTWAVVWVGPQACCWRVDCAM
ncbi:DNA ligase D [Paraburkholderia sp. GAS334]|uniref:DNA ligase D n=1 Tax=Paraburkholderia sp. GAS334 TaxID=3035131 RepID=UPI003D1B1479